jgi:hypothetical protein
MTTGRFGTGFLTTHLLSERVLVFRAASAVSLVQNEAFYGLRPPSVRVLVHGVKSYL